MHNPNNNWWKDQIILAQGWGILADFWVLHEIDSWNFQLMLDLWFFAVSQNFSSFRQLLFSLFQGKKSMDSLGRDFESFWILSDLFVKSYITKQIYEIFFFVHIIFHFQKYIESMYAIQSNLILIMLVFARQEMKEVH